MTVKERIKKYIAFKKISAREFCARINVSSAFISSMVNSMQPDKIERITLQFPDLNISWLLTGEGEMISGVDNTSVKKENTKSIEEKEHIIRYYDIEASAGGVFMYNDQRENHRNLIIPGFNDCDIALNVWGDSMEPVLKSGEIAAMREWKEPFIDWGKIYLVVTTTGYRMIKYLKKGDNKDEVICESANPAHDPFTIRISDISKLYQIKGCISRYAI